MKKLALALPLIAAMAAIVVMGAFAAVGGTQRVTIVHVQNGCHSWQQAGKTSASLALTVRRGTSLLIMNQDIDAHHLIQTAGPRLHLPGTMMMSHNGLVRFVKPGVYRFTTKVVEMAGMPEVETKGPDHVLRLTVKVV